MVEIANLTKTFGQETVLRNISVTFHPGMIYGLIGANGSGKTTLMRCILGFVRPTGGWVRVHGQLIGKEADFPQSTGILIETPGFLPQYTGLANLVILAGIAGRADKARAEEVIRLLGLDPGMKRPVGKYSLGMRQRLGIAQALMEDPRLLILDEPFNGLDKAGIGDVHRLFKELKSMGKTIVLASHNAQDIGMACDVVYEMERGRLALAGAAEGAG